MATNDFIVKNGLQVNENAAILEVTDASSSTDAAASFRTAGGAAVAKKLYVGTNLDVQGTSNLVGNATVTGDLAVNGGDITTTASAVTLFNTNATTVDAFEAATTINIGSAAGTTTVQNALTVNGAFTASPINANVAISPTGTGTVTISPAGALTINPTAASTINNTSIGASTRSTGAFTTLAANNAVTFTAGTASSSTNTGTLVVTGGVGVSGQVTATTFSGNHNGGSGSFTSLAASGAVTFTQNTGSTSTTTGTLVVTGGVGISERLYAGSIQNTPIGSSVANSAAFTTLTSNGATTFTAGTASTTTGTGTVVVTGGMGLSGAVNAGAASSFAGLTSTSTTTLSPANASVAISPTGSGTVTIAPATAGTINNMSIGATTRAAGAFTTLAANSAVTLTAGANNSSLTTTGAGVLTISSGTTGSINNMTIGATTATTGRFTTVESTIATGTAPFTVASTTLVTNLNADYVDGLQAHTGRNNEVNKIVRTDANGYIQAGWINTTSGDNGTTAIDRVYASSDSYIRYYTPTNFRAVLNVPTRTGGDASGTWAISITGNAATATNSTQLGGISSNRAILKRRTRIHTADSTSLNSSITAPEMGFSYGGSGEPTGPYICFGGLGGDIDYSCQLTGAYSGGGNDFKIRTRNDDASSWNAWRTIITDGNYNSYSPTLTGGNASGTWGINISGNATTATTATTANNSLNTNSISNAVGGSYTWTGVQYFQSNLGTTSGALSSPPLQVYATSTNAAFMSFHRGGSYAVNMGLDSDNVFRIGGWSAAANRMQLDMSGNLTIAGTFTESSSIRYKENVNPITGALEQVLQLQGVTYDRKDGSATNEPGMIAEEVAKVIPNLVSHNADGSIEGIHYSKTVAYLVECIKELNDKITRLENERK